MTPQKRQLVIEILWFVKCVVRHDLEIQYKHDHHTIFILDRHHVH